MQWSEGIKVVRGHQPLPLTLAPDPNPDPEPNPKPAPPPTPNPTPTPTPTPNPTPTRTPHPHQVSVKEREFTISDRSGKGKFADVLGDASRWKDEVESFGGGLRPDSPAKMSRPGGMTRGTPDKAPRTMGDLIYP